MTRQVSHPEAETLAIVIETRLRPDNLTRLSAKVLRHDDRRGTWTEAARARLYDRMFPDSPSS
ncbi:hypothetical protein [Rhizosaccharibacter radicis]|uniref:Uncharacterized protein n=1 Tax=Rhizosaccharibacter radicis TaxID=2782605 RepID=A0ABT1VY13_9PROT|nr:hypothetical protein [Acetobacteraceae bacterium KSS12]